MSSPSLVSHGGWHFAIPQLVVSAGSGGAMLTITLLQPTEIVLEPARVLVLHDPVGLTGDRVLAHVYREAALQVADVSEGDTCASSTGSSTDSSAGAGVGLMSGGVHLQWLVVRPPITRVWDAMDSLNDRTWRVLQRRQLDSGRARTRTFPPATQALETHAPRVAETLRTDSDPPQRARGRALMLLSESERQDALSTLATARLLTRALRKRWAVLACAREGPLTSSAAPPPPERAWCDRVVCQGGVLRPVAAR